MDPERVHAYLQVACAGLGFDIGEVWWTSNEYGSSTVAAIEEPVSFRTEELAEGETEHQLALTTGKKFRFVQLYTSRSYESRRSELVNPPEESHGNGFRRSGSSDNLQKHVLSPRLVDAISKTAQVVWATTKKREGLIGRSDIRLQTAVGMPVAMDNNGNMCVVVMFSPNNVQSTDDAMEYLYSISQSATSSSIPCLFPVFDHSIMGGMRQIGPSTNVQHPTLVPHPDPSSLGEGVSARFVSLDDQNLFRAGEGTKALSDEPEVHSDHNLSTAPKDTFGIPMLPSFAELGGQVTPEAAESEDAFDEATYGIWTTIMETNEPDDPENGLQAFDTYVSEENPGVVSAVQLDPATISLQMATYSAMPSTHPLEESRRERLVEFCQAFLGMSVFDCADVWVPSGCDSPYPQDTLRHVVTVTANNTMDNPVLNEFRNISERTLIKFWTGAVGRAFSTGNPVWSSNESSFVDSGRAAAFELTQFHTVMAVPVFSKSGTEPICVVGAYAFVKSGSVPFVLRFVQQALRLLWDGLDRIEQPHVSDDVWEQVGPADLGEMAADVEMQQHFQKKRTHQTILEADESMHLPDDEISTGSPLFQRNGFMTSSQLQAIQLPNGEIITIPLHMEETGDGVTSYETQVPASTQIYIEELRSHVSDAVRSVADAVPAPSEAPKTAFFPKTAFSQTSPAQSPRISRASAFQKQFPITQLHINTNSSGTKRAHIGYAPGIKLSALAMPRPLPSKICSSHHRNSSSGGSSSEKAASPQYGRPISEKASSPNAPYIRTISANLGFSGAKPPTLVPPQLPTLVPPQLPTLVPPQLPTLVPPQPTLTGFGMAPAAATPKVQVQSSYSSPPPSINMHFSPPPVQVQPEPSPSATICLPTGQPMHDGFHIGKASLHGRICRIQGCSEPALVKRPYCAKHSGNRQCEHVGCGKCAQGSTRFCIAHGGGRRCTFPGCDKGARDKFFCAAHGGGKRCQYEGGCTKSAVGGSTLCTAHGGGRRCDVPGCGKSAQSSTRFCVKHGGGKKCCHEGCEKVARGRTNYCAAHGGGVRCKLDGCNRVAIGKLQLCRAHGGGSSRGGRGSESDSPDTVPRSTSSVSDVMLDEIGHMKGLMSI